MEPNLQLVQTYPVETEGLSFPGIPETVEVWLEMIDSAQKSLDIGQFYIISRKVDTGSETPGRLAPVLKAIKRAAKRGVEVRIVIDSKFAATYKVDWKRLGENKNVQVRQIHFDDHTGGILHAKYFIVDGIDAFVGSQNFDWRSLEHNLELGVRVRIPEIVDSLSAVFETDWKISEGKVDHRHPLDPESGSLPVQSKCLEGESILVDAAFSPRDWLPVEDHFDLPKLVKMIDDAKERVRVQLLSYAVTGFDSKEFWEEIDNALRRAASRHVNVRMLIADWTKSDDHKLASIQSLDIFPNVDVRMVTIPEAKEGPIPFARVIHSKFMTVDDEVAWIGTSNWSKGYFYASRNVGLTVHGKCFAKQLSDIFDQTWSSVYSYEVIAGPLCDVLNKVQICRNQGKLPILIFDLDDTIFSTRERTLRIMQEFSVDYSDKFPEFVHALDRVRASDIRYGIDPTLNNIGIDDAELSELLKEYWFNRFFKDDYLAIDIPTPGSVEFVNACFKNGALIYYCTGRHHRMRGAVRENTPGTPSEGMERGTIRALLDRGFPVCSGRTILHLKGSFQQDDAEFKDRDALPAIRSLGGQVVATFENEPENANIFLEAFPEAMNFWLQTQHKPDAKPADPRLRKIFDFYTKRTT